MSQSPNPAAPQQVAPLLALAAQLLRAGRPADAIAPLRDAALLQPSNPIIQHDLGLACLEVGRVPDAIAALQRAVASNPRYADAYFRLGIALEKLGDIGGAIVAYDRATKLRPSPGRGLVPRRRPGLRTGASRRGDRLFPPRGGDRRQDQLRPAWQSAGAAGRGSQSGSRTGAATDAGARSGERHGAWSDGRSAL